MSTLVSVHEPVDPVVAVCETHAAADASVRALGRAGFEMKKLSVVGKGYHTTEHDHRLPIERKAEA